MGTWWRQWHELKTDEVNTDQFYQNLTTFYDAGYLEANKTNNSISYSPYSFSLKKYNKAKYPKADYKGLGWKSKIVVFSKSNKFYVVKGII